jgi:flagellar biosynthesis anti-sigma factor FlgM
MAGLNGISSLGAVPGIHSTNGNVNAASSVAESAASATRTTNGSNSSAPVNRTQDQASVSSAGGLVAQALNTSDVRLDKVAALQSQIASGTYSVSSQDVASKIVDSLLK